MSHEKARELLIICEEELVKVRNELNSGNVANMQEFETVVGQLCEEIAKMPVGETAEYQESLKALGDALTAIAQIMEQNRNELKTQMEGLSDHKKANVAYLRSDNMKE